MGDVSDQRALGQLESSVEHLTEAVKVLTLSIQELNARVLAIETRTGFARAKVTGIVIGLGLAGYGAVEGLTKALSAVLK